MKSTEVKKVIALGVLTGGLVLQTSGAVAGAVATSYVNVSGFQFVDTLTNEKIVLGLNNAVDSALTDFQFQGDGILNNGDTASTLVVSGQTVTGSNSGPVSGSGLFDVDTSCVGECGSYVDNSFSYIPDGTMPTDTYVVGDAQLEGAAINVSEQFFNAQNDPDIPAPANGVVELDPGNVQTLAEVSLASTEDGTANGNTLGSNGNFTFTANAAAEVRVDFTLTTFLRAAISSDAAFGSDATADWSLGVNVRKLNSGVACTTPNIASLDCINLGLTNLISADRGEDNSNSEVLVLGDGTAPGSELFQEIRTFTVEQGVTYQVNITQTSQANANFVPAPAPLALLGAGLLALGFRLRGRRAV